MCPLSIVEVSEYFTKLFSICGVSNKLVFVPYEGSIGTKMVFVDTHFDSLTPLDHLFTWFLQLPDFGN